MSRKQKIIETLLKRFETFIEEQSEITKSNSQDATHDEMKAEDQYDTRAIEASYLAGAQKARLQELQAHYALLKNFEPKKFTKNDPIALGALVDVEDEMKKRKIYFLSPVASEPVELEGKKVIILSMQSPLASDLLTLKVGEFLEIENPPQELEILSVE